MDVTKEKTESKKRLFLIVIPILLGSIISNVYFWSNRNTLLSERDSAVLRADSCLSARLQVEKHLNETETALNDCKSKTEQLNITISKLNDEISEKTTVLNKITASNANVSSLKKQIKETAKLRDDCEKQVNALLKEKSDLETKMAALNKSLTSIKNENEDLKKKLEWAKDLKVYDITVLNYKATKSKQKETVKARKVNRMSVSFTLAENMVAEAGSKTINLVIYNPKKAVLGNIQNQFTNTKTKEIAKFSSSKTVDYKNEMQKITINFDSAEKLIKGKYIVEIYVNGAFAGKKDFELK